MILPNTYKEYCKQHNGKPKLSECEFNELINVIHNDTRSNYEILLEHYLTASTDVIYKLNDMFENIFLAPSPIKTEEEFIKKLDEMMFLLLKAHGIAKQNEMIIKTHNNEN